MNDGKFCSQGGQVLQGLDYRSIDGAGALAPAEDQ
jgi:hypothetical protein